MPDDRTYIRVHDGMPDHPKIEPLSDAAFRLLVTLWCWSARHLTDGKIPPGIWLRRGNSRARRELMGGGLVEVDDMSGIVQLHDYLEHQRSAEQVAELREKRREAGSRGGKAKAAKALASAKQVPKQTPSKPVPETDTDTEEEQLLGARPRREVRPRAPDPIWDALTAACGIDTKQLTTTARGATNRAVAELRAIDATPDQIRTRAGAYRRTYPNVALTPSALVKHWGQLNGTRPPTAPYHAEWPT
jgi:hypothetical protein